MPWNQESPMNQRIKLVADWLSGNYTKPSWHTDSM